MKRIISLLTLCVIAIFSCVTLSSCYMPVFGFTITGEGVEITELDNKRYFKGEVITFGADVLDGKEGKIVALGDDLLADVDSLVKVVIPEGVTRIGARAFEGCDNLEEVILPSTLKYIGDDAFADCPKLKTNTESVGEYELKLRYLGTPDNEYFALVGCDDFEASEGDDAVYTININSNTVLVANGALEDKTSRSTELCVPDSVRYIGDRAFAYSSVLRAEVSENVEVIGFGAFEGCESLRELTIPFVGSEKVHDLGAGIVFEPEATHFGYIFGASRFDLSDTKVPKTLTSVTVTGTSPIAENAFRDCKFLKSVTVLSDVGTIGFAAFAGCDSIEFMSLPFVGESAEGLQNPHLGHLFGARKYENNATFVPNTLRELHITGEASIGNYALAGLTGIKKVYLNDKIVRVSNTAFVDCKFGYNGYNGGFYLGSPDSPYLVLVEVVDKFVHDYDFIEGTYLIAEGAFANCTALDTIVIPDHIAVVGDYAFLGCAALKNIVVSAGAGNISNLAFSGCSSIESIALSLESGKHSVKKILSSANATLKYVTITGGTSISSEELCNLRALKSVAIPASMKVVANGAFNGCGSLAAVYIDDLAAWCKISFADNVANPLYTAEKLYLDGELITDLVIPDEITTIGNYTFVNGTAFKSVFLPEGVSSVSTTAFSGCSNVESITLSLKYAELSVKSILKNLTSKLKYVTVTSGTTIDSKEFSDLKALKEINLPASITSIGASAFEGCVALSAINFGDNSQLSSIGKQAFSGCSSISKFVIFNGVENIGERAFYACTALETIEVEAGNTKYESINGNLYSDDKSILIQYAIGKKDTSFEILDHVTNIGNYAFSRCAYLQNIVISDNVDNIGNYTWDGCKALETVSIGENSKLVTIGDSTFSGCSALGSMYVPASVTGIGSSAFSKCTSLETVGFGENSKLETIGGSAFFGCSKLEIMCVPASVTGIGSSAFSKCEALEAVSFGENSKLETINNSAFSGCIALTSIVIPDGVTEIGSSAFSKCEVLEAVSFGENSELVTIGNNAFSECSSIKTISVPDGVTNISDSVFSKCTSLETVSFGENSKLETISNSAFSGCIALANIVIPHGVTEIGSSAFSDCVSLVSIVIPDGVTEIGNSAFSGCVALRTANISENSALVSIGSNAFYECSSLVEIVIPVSVTKIEEAAFEGCVKLAAVYISDIAKWCGIEFENESANPLYLSKRLYLDGSLVKDLVIPEGVEYVGEYAFINGECIKSVVIPVSVTQIGTVAFDGCVKLGAVYISDIAKWCGIKFEDESANPLYLSKRLYLDGSLVKDLIIPEGVKSVGAYAFINCYSLTSVVIPESVTRIKESVFDGCDGLEAVYISDIAKWCSMTFENYTANPLYLSGALYLGSSLVKDLVIPEGVKYVGAYAFTDYTELVSIVLPNSIEYVGDEAFSGCDEVQRITLSLEQEAISVKGILGSSITELNYVKVTGGTAIDDSEFANLRKLTEIVLSDSIQTIGAGAFKGCRSLKAVKFGSGSVLESIGNNAFSNCADLAGIDLPKSVTSIGNSAFSGCTDLESIVLPKGVTNIGVGAFSGCNSKLYKSYKSGTYVGNSDNPYSVLIEVTEYDFSTYIIHARTEFIANKAFSICEQIESIHIPAGVINICTSAFENLVTLETVTFSKDANFMRVGDAAFAGCTAIKRIVLPRSAVSIGNGAFANCTSLKRMIMPDRLTSVGNGAFADCVALKRVTFGTSSQLASIGNNAFSGCISLSKIAIPDRVTAIEEGTFNGCTSLRTVIIGKNVKVISENAFSDCTNLSKIKYRLSASDWQEVKKNIAPGNGALDGRTTQFGEKATKYKYNCILGNFLWEYFWEFFGEYFLE